MTEEYELEPHEEPGTAPPAPPAPPADGEVLGYDPKGKPPGWIALKETRLAQAAERAAGPAPTITEPIYPTDVKPDKPGGQIATIKGAETYIPGSTMYELGFRTNQEYLDAQSRGIVYGPHPGAKVPEGSVLVTDTVSGRKQAMRITPHDVGIQGKVSPHLLTKRKLAKQWATRTVEGQQVLIPAKAAERIALLKGKAKFEARVAAGIIPTGAFFISEREYIPASRMAEIKRDTPDMYKILVDDGYRPYIRAIEEHNKAVKEFELKHIKLADDKWMLIKDYNAMSVEGRTIALRQGFGALDRRYKANKAAITKLTPYTDQEGSVDASKYLRDNPKDTQTLIIAGLQQADVNSAVTFNTMLADFTNRVDGKGKPFTLGEADALIETIRASGFRAKTPIGTSRTKNWNELTEEQKITVALRYAPPSPMRAAELTVPFVYTARNWTTLSTKDKIINLAIDIGSVVLCLGIFRAAGVVTRQLTGINRVAGIATKAGIAGKELKDATKAFATAQKLGVVKPGSSLWVKHANKVAQLQAKSMKADNLFLRQLEKIDSLSPRELASLEKRSGLKGIVKAIKDIGKAQDSLDKAWKALGKLKFNPNATTPRQIGANNRYLRALAKVQTAQVRLQSALGRAGSTLQPRYTPSPPAAEFKGYGVEWKPSKPAPVVDVASPETLSSINTQLGLKPKVKVAVVEKQVVVGKPRYVLKLKAVYKKAKATPAQKPKVPEVKPSVFPGIKTVKRAAPAVAPALPAETLGRMTYDQIAKRYGTDTEGVVDAVAKTIEEHLQALKGLEKLTPFSKEGIKELTRAGIMAFIEAQKANLTARALREAVRQAVESQVAAKPAMATQAKLATDVIVKVATRAITKPVLKPIRPLKPFRPIKPVVALFPGGASDKEKRKTIKAADGAIAWRHGELHGKDVWHVGLYPYTSEENWGTVLGKKPAGATIVKGPGSAKQTIKLLYGKAPPRKITGDIGFFDWRIKPVGVRKVDIEFEPDPKMQTTGDITLGRRTPPITERRPALSSRGKGFRITPRTPALRR